jgi:1-acyl-sn-glycerol-3-phosphate acyltransferase
VIRTLWVAFNVAAATLFFGLIAILASILRVRGRIYPWATQEWSRAILWASNTPVVAHGMERVRWQEPQVLVSNHLSWYDVFAIASVLPVPFHFVAKKELERIPFFGTAWKAAGHISVDRSNRQKAILSLRRAGEKIRREKSTVIIFPEGTRSRSGQLQAFKKGAFMLAMEAGVPVVPTVVSGSYEIMRPGSWSIRPRAIHLHFGIPISTAGFDVANAGELTERVRGEMLAMIEAGMREQESA